MVLEIYPVDVGFCLLLRGLLLRLAYVSLCGLVCVWIYVSLFSHFVGRCVVLFGLVCVVLFCFLMLRLCVWLICVWLGGLGCVGLRWVGPGGVGLVGCLVGWFVCCLAGRLVDGVGVCAVCCRFGLD